MTVELLIRPTDVSRKGLEL